MLEKGGVLHIRSILVVCRLKAKQVCLLHYFSLLTFCSFFSRYLSCVSQTMKKLQPFGDVPKKLTEQLRRSFVASRTFAQALLEGKQIVNKISKIPPKDECVKALTKMSSCPACQGIPEIQPCRGYCINVMKGCLAFHAQLSDSWNEFIGKCVFKVQTKTHFSKKKISS